MKSTSIRSLVAALAAAIAPALAFGSGGPVTNTDTGISYATIQEAVTAASPGDTLVLAAGDHSGSAITIGKAITLQGPNAGTPGSSESRTAEARIVDMKMTLTAAVVIDGVEIYQTNDTADALLVQAAAVVRNSVIRRDGISTGTIARGITTTAGANSWVVEDNLFTGDPSGGMFGGHTTWNTGLWINGGSGTASGNAFENCRTAINADDFNAGITITGNSFSNCGTFLAFGGTTPTDGQYAIAGNAFGIDWNDPDLPSAFFNNSNVAATFRLDATVNTYGSVDSADLSDLQKLHIEARNYHRGRSNRNGVVDVVADEQLVMPGTTIQSAINAASAGDRVLVGPGVYEDRVQLNKAGITVVSAGGADLTVIRGGTIDFLADGITLEGFRIETTDSGRAIATRQSNNTVIRANTITVADGVTGTRGIQGADYYGKTGEQTNTVIEGNTFSGFSNGIAGTEKMKELVIRNNTFEGMTSNAIGLGAGVELADPIAGNTFRNGTNRYLSNYEPALMADPDFYDEFLANNDLDRSVLVRNSDGDVVVHMVYATIQRAVDNAVSGQIVDVSAGVYPEKVVTRPAHHTHLRGPNSEISAVDLGSRVPEALVLGGIAQTSDLAPQKVTIRGFRIDNTDWTGGSGVGIYARGGPCAIIENNWISNVSGNGIHAYTMTTPSERDLIRGNRVENAQNAAIGTLGLRNVEISGNYLDSPGDQGIALSATGSQIIENVDILDNVIVNAGASRRDPFQDDRAGIRIRTDNPTGPYSGGGKRLVNLTIRGNTISGSNSGIASVAANDQKNDWGSYLIEYNNLAGNLAGGSIYNPSTETSIPLVAMLNYWGEEVPNFSEVITGEVVATPWFADAAMTDLRYVDAEGNSTIVNDTTVDPDSTLTVPGELTLTANLTVNGGTLSVGSLNLAPGAVLQINEGTLILGDGSVMSGTFTFFDSLGSVHFDGDIEITGSATGLILVTDVHVASGATITVDGTLIIDGSVVDSPGTFTLEVADGASFTMARTVFVNGALVLNSGDVKVYDNRFENSTITVGETADGAMVYHNLTDNLGWLIDDGLNTVTMVDGWGNVTSFADTENRLLLGLDIDGLEGRTAVGGHVYIQPGDAFLATVDVSELNTKIVGVDMLLGYNTDLLTASSVGLLYPWDVELDALTDSSAVIGKIDRSIGLALDFGDPDGTNLDGTIADVALSAGQTESQTQVFFRVKLDDDTFAHDTQLTEGGPSPAYLAPFTANTGIITIDATAPEIDEASATVEQDGVDMTIEGNITIQGDLDITVAAMDALAGIDADKAVVTLMQDEVVVYTADQTGTEPVTIEDVDYTQYAFTYTVTPATENGLYDVLFTVTDRSGNISSANLGVVEINKNQVEATIILEGVTVAELERTVTLVFTDETEAVIETRTPSVTFIEGTATVTLTNVPEAAVALSAKTAWTLHERAELVLVDGQATPEYTLRGGDLNGDNVVNMLDFAILRYYWTNEVSEVPAAAAADITGSGAVSLTDFNILQANFGQSGDPQ